jgi:hypothetical protein
MAFGNAPLDWVNAYLRGDLDYKPNPNHQTQLGIEGQLTNIIVVASIVDQARNVLGDLITTKAQDIQAGDLVNLRDTLTALDRAKSDLIAVVRDAAANAFPKSAAQALEDIADAQAMQTALANEGPPVELIASVDAVADQIKEAALRPNDPLKRLVDGLLPSDADARGALTASDPGAWQVLLAAMPTVLQALQLASPVLIFKAIPLVMDFVKDHYPELAERIAPMGEALGPLLMDGVELLHGPMKAVMERGVELFFHALRHELDKFGQVTPENVFEVAGALVSEAGAIGMSSHLVANLAEHFHPGKELGFPQLAAFLADLSDFRRVASETLGQHVSAALHSPSRRRALQQFRPELPDPFAWAEIFFGRHISEQEFAEFYEQHGWSDEHVAAYTEAIHRKASPRELALVFEDGEIRDEWALRMLQRGGFNDEDAALLLSGVKTRALKGARQAYIDSVLASYEEGLYDEETVAGLLDRLRLGEETRQLVIVTAQTKRLRGEATKLRTVYETLADNGSIPADELQAVMAALGYDERSRQMAAARVSAKLAGKAFHEVEKDTAAALHRAQTDNATALKEAYRRFEITFEQLVAGLLAIGLRPEEAGAIARVAAESVVPVPELPRVLTVERALQESLKKEAEGVLALLRNGDTTPEEAYATLLSFGVLAAEARADVDLAAARLTFPTPAGARELRTPDVRAREAAELREQKAAERADERELRALLTAQSRAAEEEFKKGTIGPDELLASLVGFGQSQESAAAVVKRLSADRSALSRATLERTVRQEAQRVENIARDAAVLAFRNDKLDAHGLLVELVGAGVDVAEANAIVARELARKKPPATKTAAATDSPPELDPLDSTP